MNYLSIIFTKLLFSSILLFAHIIFAIDPPFGRLSVHHGQLVNSVGKPVVLRGISLFNSEWQLDFWTPDVVKAIKCYYNANVVRLAVGTDHPWDDMDRIINIVNASIDLGLYVLIDWHNAGDGGYDFGSGVADFNAFVSNAVDFFSFISHLYADVPNMLYEMWSEPAWVEWRTIKYYHYNVMVAIRINDKRAVIIVGTPDWSTGPNFDVIHSPVVGYNILYALHWYAIDDKLHHIMQHRMIINAKSSGLGTFVSEYGTTTLTEQAPVEYEMVKLWWKFLEKSQVSYINWSMSNKNESTAIIKPNCTPDQITQEQCITESGIFLRNHLWSFDNGVKCGKI
ncbi:Cellulase domain-containing protein [Meloidogyne graminicola]|uniref:Cellulase domain-containing protein n=1 Tax=Meloidogyne graminicola TaxID=189291 RepID=A0A8S9ZFH6_9BILA|nr:Cellulase domain-containing protein [Meloidogyne graminicola]